MTFMELSVTTLGQHSYLIIFLRRNKNKQYKQSCGQSNYNDQINNLVLVEFESIIKFT